MAINRFLTLDIGASTLKLAEFISTGSGNMTLVNFTHARLALNPSPDENQNPNIVATLKRLISEKGFKARRAVISVSGQTVLTRFMKLPSTEESKLRQMVRYEAAQNVPFPIEEVVWDFHVLGSRTETDLEVVMVAMKSEIIEGLNQCVEEAGLDVEVVDVSQLAIYNALLFNYEPEQGCTLLLDIGARTTNLIFVEPKKLFTRSIPIAGNSITQSIAQEFEISFDEAEDLKVKQGFVGLGGAYEEPEPESAARLSKIIRNIMTRLHADIARSINFYKAQQGGTAPKRLLLSGGTAIIPYADHFFKEKMEIDIEYFNPFKNIPIQVPHKELEKVVHSMGEMVGLALRVVTECPLEVNLVPNSIIKHRQFQKKIPWFAGAMGCVLCIVLSWWLYYWRITNMHSDHLAEITQEVDGLTAIKKNLKKARDLKEAAAAQSEQIQQVVELRYFWLKFLDELNSRMTAAIWITEFRPRDNGASIGIFTSSALVAAPVVTGAKKPAGKPLGGGAVAKAAPKTLITEFEVHCLCLTNPDPLNPTDPQPLIRKFLEDMKKSPYFSEIKEGNLSDPSGWTFTFSFTAKLKNPIPY